jgi:surfactin synthase thioesterase subunit
MNKICLYCLPFAGGNSYSYRPLQEILANTVQMLPLELPGRGKRMREGLVTDLNALAGDAFKQLIMQDLTQKYALFGHSMGALLVYLVAQQLVAARLPLPNRIFVSGHRAPSVSQRLTMKHNLPKSEFIAMLQQLGGCPPEILQDAELMNFFEPVLRADLQAAELYQYQPTLPLPIPITVMFGTQEAEVTYQEAAAWQQETTYPLVINAFKGGHFFIFEQTRQVAQIMAQNLR